MIRPERCGADPQVVVEMRRYRWLIGGDTRHPAIAADPGMDLAHLSDGAGLNQLHDPVHVRDGVPLRAEIKTDYAEGTVKAVTMHDGSVVKLRKVDEDYDPSDRSAVLDHLSEAAAQGEIATGLLYLEEAGDDMHGFENTVDTPLVEVPYEELCPGSAALAELQKEWV